MKTLTPAVPGGLGQPVWELAERFPVQGAWSAADLFRLPDNRRIELVDGRLEFLPMPTTSHQRILAYLYRRLYAFVTERQLGEALFAGIKLRVAAGKVREPDVIFLLTEHQDQIGEDCWDRADLVMEVVSGSRDDRDRDLNVKRVEYAQVKVAEYWIVDPEAEEITVLRLSRRKYVVHGIFGRGARAASALLKGFDVSVDDALDGSRN